MAEAYRLPPQPETGALTLSELWAQFVAERSIALCATSLATDYRQVTRWIERCPLTDPSEGRQILRWVLEREPVLAARRVCMYLRGMYRWAVTPEVGLLPSNPVANFRMPKAPQRRCEVAAIPKAEVSVVLSALGDKERYKAANWALFADFMLQTALRTGEVRAARWSDIKGARLLVHSNYTLTHGHKNTTKTNKERWVPLNARAKEILRLLPRDDEYIFPWNRRAFQSYFSKRMTHLHATGAIAHRYRPYDLRHAAISHWLEAGVPVTQAAKWAGNTSEVIWRHYAGTTQHYEIPVL